VVRVMGHPGADMPGGALIYDEGVGGMLVVMVLALLCSFGRGRGGRGATRQSSPS
jgi:hypothetical protein